jgi:hypothetical protein
LAANFSGMYSSHVKAALFMVYCNFCKLHNACNGRWRY